jgi:hypothetical protein
MSKPEVEMVDVARAPAPGASPAGYGAPPANHGAPPTVAPPPDSTASDRKMPNDAKAQSTPMTNLEKILMAVVSVAILVFIVFQGLLYANGRSDPVVQFDSNFTEARKFPGILVCPFSIVQRSAIDAIRDGLSPDWSPDALLSFDTPGVRLLNTNVDAASNRQDPKKCPSNNVISANPVDRDGLPHLYYNDHSDKQKKVLVKNGAKPLTIKEAGTMNSWTPPNVECFIFDHRSFAVDPNPVCNPMVETRANSEDSLLLNMGFRSDRHTPEYTYTYTGLKPSGPSNRPYPTSSKNETEMQKFFYDDWHAAVFGGVVAVFYDSSKERPASLNFDGALTNSLSVPDSTQVLHSAVLLSTACQPNPCLQKVAPRPFIAAVTNEYNTLLDSSTSITQSVAISTSIIDQTTFTIDNQAAFFADISVKFAASYSTKRTQAERVALLTVLSVIVSTAATIWKSQEAIKEYIEMAIEYLQKRRAPHIASESSTPSRAQV